MHLKRHTIPKSWPIPRKGKTFVVRPGFNYELGIPALVVLRDILKVAQNKKEVKRAIFLKNILVNNKPLRDEKNSVLLFDTITLVPMKKFYRLSMGTNGKFNVEEISEKEATQKIVKIADKKSLKGKKVQLNFRDGKNIISDVKCKTNDSAIIDFLGKKILKILPLQPKAKVFIYSGKHGGKTGEVLSIDSKEKVAEVKFPDGNVRVLIKQMIVVE